MPEILFNKTTTKQDVELTAQNESDILLVGSDGVTEWHYWYKNKDFIINLVVKTLHFQCSYF